MADTAYWFCYLNSPTDEQINEFILWQFENMWKKYSKAAYGYSSSALKTNSDHARRIAKDIIEISYEEIACRENSIGTLKKIYRHLDVVLDDNIERRFQQELIYLNGYKPNVHSGLPKTMRNIIYGRWEDYFAHFNYKFGS
jgi:hypothetical protein